MKPVTPAVVAQSIENLSRATGVETAFDYLDRMQPNVPVYSMIEMEDHDSQYGIHAIMICYFVVSALAQAYGRQIPQCDADKLVACSIQNKKLFDIGAEMKTEPLMAVMQLEIANQPHLMSAVQKLLFSAERQIDAKSQAAALIQIYFVAKTIVDTIDSLTDEDSR